MESLLIDLIILWVRPSGPLAVWFTYQFKNGYQAMANLAGENLTASIM